MKKLLLLTVNIIGCLVLSAQPTAREVRQNGIRKAIIQTTDAAGYKDEQTYWYDKNGYDSLHLLPGAVLYFHNHTLNGRLQKQVCTNEYADTIHTRLYLFTAREIKITRLDSLENIESHSWYNYNHQLLRKEMADGSSFLYEYDPSGKLHAVRYLKPALTWKEKRKNEPVTIERYFYDRYGQLDKKEVYGTGQTITSRYSNKAEGIITEIMHQTWEGRSFVRYTDRFYNSKGLIEKIVQRSNHGEGESPVESTTEIQYEYY